jgi:hypothetical protein
METFFTALGLSLFGAAIVMMVGIVRDVFPCLDEQDRVSFRALAHPGEQARASSGGWARAMGIVDLNPALRHAWEEHTRQFPKSRKRVLFACLAIAACLSPMGYPLWLAVGPR